MIIRHDLEIVFIHVPKCAGKQLRRIFKTTENQSAIEELWNFEYNEVLERYVDLAHLPLSDLIHYPQFKYLDQYKVIACIRNPYMRLASAVNEYYRQKSKKHEDIVKSGKITSEMKARYYKKMKRKHDELDPRFVHSLPIYRFTHYGQKPKVDYLLRCENLTNDMEELARKLEWPKELLEAIPRHLSNKIPHAANLKLTSEELELAEATYHDDLDTFGYREDNRKITVRSPRFLPSGSIRQIHQSEAVEWHWGPRAMKRRGVMIPVREKC